MGRLAQHQVALVHPVRGKLGLLAGLAERGCYGLTGHVVRPGWRKATARKRCRDKRAANSLPAKAITN